MFVHVVADASELTGMTNLMSYYGLEHSYNKFGIKKVKEELSAFLPALPGNIDTSGNQDNRFAVFMYCGSISGWHRECIILVSLSLIAFI